MNKESRKMHSLPVIFTGTAPTKSEIDKQCESIIKNITESGEVDPLKVATAMKALETAMKTIKAGISKAILDEAEKYEKSFTYDGHNIIVKEGGVKYDYSLCCDPVLTKLEKDAADTAQKLKDRQKILQAIQDQLTVVDDDTGEVFTVLPPAKKSTTTVAITLAK